MVGFGMYFEEAPTRLACGWGVEGEEKGIEDNFSAVDPSWVWAPFTEYGEQVWGDGVRSGAWA